MTDKSRTLKQFQEKLITLEEQGLWETCQKHLQTSLQRKTVNQSTKSLQKTLNLCLICEKTSIKNSESLQNSTELSTGRLKLAINLTSEGRFKPQKTAKNQENFRKNTRIIWYFFVNKNIFLFFSAENSQKKNWPRLAGDWKSSRKGEKKPTSKIGGIKNPL